MNVPGSGNVSLRTVSFAASDDYYSLSDRTTTSSSRTPSAGSRLTVQRYATPNSHPVSHTSSPAVSRTHLGANMAGSRSQHSILEQSRNGNVPPSAPSPARFEQGRLVPVSGMSNESIRHVPNDSYAGRSPTPGTDDLPYIRFAINQLTREDEPSSLSRQSSVASVEYPPQPLVWDAALGQFTRPSKPKGSPLRPSQERIHPQSPPERSPQNSVDPEAFVAVDPPDNNLLYPPLNFVPIVLRPWALAVAIFSCLLMIAGVVFCNVWSQRHEGIWDYDGQGGSRYFVVQFLPQILAAIITIWTFVIQAAVYRVMPFAIMASEKPHDRVIQKLPILSRNFLLPDWSYFRHGEPLAGFALLTIWISNLILIPLFSCFFQAKWYLINGEGQWRWNAVIAVGWTIVAFYALLALGLTSLLIRFMRTRSGLMWDPVSLADLIPVIQRSNVLHDFEQSETMPDVGSALEPRVLRLGYWQVSNRAEVFYGVAEADAPIRNPSLHRPEMSREKQPLVSRVSFDIERRSTHAAEGFEQQLYSQTVRYRWAPWFLRDSFVVAWSVTIGALFIAFVLVSFIHDAIKGGFPPQLPTLPSTGAFSSSNFLYSFIPALIGNILFLSWQPIDVYFRALQPYATLSSPDGARAEQTLLLEYPASFPLQVTVQAILNAHHKVAWISMMSIVSAALPILAGGVFIALWYPSHEEVRIAALMPAFYTLVAFCALYTVSFLCIWPRRCRYLPHDISTLADQISFFYQSPLLADKLLREPRISRLRTVSKLEDFVVEQEKDDLERGYTISFDFPQKFANFLIGKRGENINKLCEEFDVDIKVDSRGSIQMTVCDKQRQQRQKNEAPRLLHLSQCTNQGTMSAANLLSLFKIQYEIIDNPTPVAEVLVTPKGINFYTEYWGLLPFARGNVHIASTDPLQQPTINPNCMMLGWDMQQQIGTGKFIRKLFNTAPMSEHTTGESTPGYTTLPASVFMLSEQSPPCKTF
ncbi:hypothetical protein CDV55_102741 [Aspergillus turcosus]|uniref:K Homology domain-containing protein n=1 Tax=Aspergillus turcosus TaxID=1245748 RepID=A0A397GSV3_9EURO|nr:hypothetical protein CDV55_102741 [Aspergillus turcosus]RLL94433.1 hypothetical protein CFD26_102247 [Aspergillus turcosus]